MCISELQKMRLFAHRDRAEEHVAESRLLALRQRGLIIRIRAAGIDTSNAERTLKVLERNLKTLEEYRDALKRR